jgi:hypothetical protein
VSGGLLLQAASVGEVLSVAATNPTAFQKTLSQFSQLYASAVNEIATMKPASELRWAYSYALLQSAYL